MVVYSDIGNNYLHRLNLLSSISPRYANTIIIQGLLHTEPAQYVALYNKFDICGFNIHSGYISREALFIYLLYSLYILYYTPSSWTLINCLSRSRTWITFSSIDS